MTSAIGDALLELVVRHRPSLRQVAGWLREASRPPAGVVLQAEDGSLYSGVVVVRDGVPIAMFAMKTSSRRQHRPPAPSPYFERDSLAPWDDDDLRY